MRNITKPLPKLFCDANVMRQYKFCRGTPSPRRLGILIWGSEAGVEVDGRARHNTIGCPRRPQSFLGTHHLPRVRRRGKQP